MKRVLNYVKDTKGELKHVSWPTRRQTLVFTLVVVAISFFVALFLGLFDYIFAQIIEYLVF
ncbi:MAG: preprotein translocase subunit SecE [Candidatus Paceibacterota bacterium]|nr:MAG: preprotein translocase subunit SecE [Candidatus Paceibacterota bacterium]